MKITKYAQSCILIETQKTKILIDPGIININEETIKEWMNPDYIFVTHKHSDHFDEASVEKIISQKTKIYSTNETSRAYQKLSFLIIKEGNKIDLGKIKVEIVKGLHGHHALFKEENIIHEEVGYILEIEGKKIYHPGDTISFPNDYNCDIIFTPFNNHGVCMSPFEAALFAKHTNASLVIPIHYDNTRLPGDINKFKEELEKNQLNYKFLKIGESIEV